MEPQSPDNRYNKPDLKKQSVVFNTVIGVALGVVVGAVIAVAAEPLLFSLSKTRRLNYGTVGNAIKKSIAADMITVGGMGGLAAYEETKGTNQLKDKTRPYVEQLEAERDALLNDAVTSRQDTIKR